MHQGRTLGKFGKQASKVLGKIACQMVLLSCFQLAQEVPPLMYFPSLRK